MKTNLDLDDRLLQKATRRAVEEGWTLGQLIECALRQFLGTGGFKLDLLTKKGRPVSGVSLDERRSLYDQMEGPAAS